MNQNRNQRARSYFYNMRKFHNTIKRSLYNKYTNNTDNLLDLACGKGGDLDKWVSNNIKNVVGYDIDSNSIKEAKRRITEYNSKYTNIEVHVKDLSRNIIDGNKKFDTIASMFAFHYFFESKDTFETIMTSIENNLKDDGIFMGTMFDGEQMRNLIKKDDFKLIDNSKELRFRVALLNESTDFFGNKISVFLKDTVLQDPMDEYLVYFTKFVEIMKLRNFELIESKMFKELYVDTFKLNSIEKVVSFLNRTFVFKKITQTTKESTSLCKSETSYLIDCNWSKPMINIILEKYKKALTNNINNTNSILLKKQYTFIRDNFENMNIDILPLNLREYYTTIFNMYLLDIEKYK